MIEGGIPIAAEIGFDTLMRRFASREHLMGAKLKITRTDHTSAELRSLAAKCTDGALVRRILALALVLDDRPRSEAAALNGMDRQTLCDWVHRYNAAGRGGWPNSNSGISGISA